MSVTHDVHGKSFDPLGVRYRSRMRRIVNDKENRLLLATLAFPLCELLLAMPVTPANELLPRSARLCPSSTAALGTMDLILVRHGATDADAGICRGHADLPLSTSGFTDVQKLAASWHGPPPRFLFSSDLRRAQQTAQVFAAAFAIEPLADARLREVDFGNWNGRHWLEITQTDAARYRHWLDNWVVQEAPDGESFADVVSRTGSWLAALLGSTQREDCVLAIAHAGSIRALLCHALGLPPDRALTIGIDEACISRVRYANGRFEVRTINAARFEAH